MDEMKERFKSLASKPIKKVGRADDKGACRLRAWTVMQTD